VTKEELQNVALESTRTIEIDEFVQRKEIDPRYNIKPCYLRPDGKVGHDPFAAIREAIREMEMVAIDRVVLTNREHIITLGPMEKGLVGTLLIKSPIPTPTRSKLRAFSKACRPVTTENKRGVKCGAFSHPSFFDRDIRYLE